MEYNYVTKQSLLNPLTINFGHNYAKIWIFLLQATTKKSQCSTFSKYGLLHHACFSVRVEPVINESGHDGFANMERNPAISFVFAANWHHCNKERAVLPCWQSVSLWLRAPKSMDKFKKMSNKSHFEVWTTINGFVCSWEPSIG